MTFPNCLSASRSRKLEHFFPGIDESSLKLKNERKMNDNSLKDVPVKRTSKSPQESFIIEMNKRKSPTLLLKNRPLEFSSTDNLLFGDEVMQK